MTLPDYFLGYGTLGAFGRFHPLTLLPCRRGQRVVVRTPRGIELATVLGQVRPDHESWLPSDTVGQLLRHATTEDDETGRQRQEQGQHFFLEASRLAVAQGLPLQVLDVEYLLDGEHAVLHVLSWADYDPRTLLASLARRFEVSWSLQDVSLATLGEKGCGRPGCGISGCCATGEACSSCELCQDSGLGPVLPAWQNI